ncbi:MAG: hypothetical protein ACK4UN_04770, partial [Limisphaerales bacterium]
MPSLSLAGSLGSNHPTRNESRQRLSFLLSSKKAGHALSKLLDQRSVRLPDDPTKNYNSHRMNHIIRNLLVASSFCMAVTASAQVTVFYDNMENGVNGWTQYGSSNGWDHDGGLWHQSSLRAYGAGGKSWYYGFENSNTYDIGENMGALISPEFDLTGYSSATLTLKQFVDLEEAPGIGNDFFFAWVFDDQGGCTLIEARSTGRANGWETLTFNLAEHVGRKVQLAFEVQ